MTRPTIADSEMAANAGLAVRDEIEAKKLGLTRGNQL
jgi:hypothetical protein